MNTPYERDFHAWLQDQAALLKAGRLAELDIENLTEEIESMGASERRELYSRMKVLLQHLLKFQFQPEGRSAGWLGTIDEQRDQLEILFKQSPSLRRLADEALDFTYPKARRAAAHETGLAIDLLPESCPYTTDEALDSDFWPGHGDARS